MKIAVTAVLPLLILSAAIAQDPPAPAPPPAAVKGVKAAHVQTQPARDSASADAGAGKGHAVQARPVRDSASADANAEEAAHVQSPTARDSASAAAEGAKAVVAAESAAVAADESAAVAADESAAVAADESVAAPEPPTLMMSEEEPPKLMTSEEEPPELTTSEDEPAKPEPAEPAPPEPAPAAPEPVKTAAPEPVPAPAAPEPAKTAAAEPAEPPKQAAAEAPKDTAAAPGKQIVAVYMAGQEPPAVKGVHSIIGGELAKVMSESDKYTAVDRTEAILEQMDKEHVYQRGGAVDDEQIKAIGHQLGVQYLCISNINPVGKRYYLDTRFVDIVTAEIKRSVTATSSLKDADEMARVGRNIALELLEAEKTRRQRILRKKIFRYTAIGLDVLGAGAFAYGYLENSNIVTHIQRIDNEGVGGGHIENGPEAKRCETRRNAAYIAGSAFLASGVTIHILF